VSGLLTALPFGDLSALDLGLKQFLEEVRQAGQDLARHPEETWLCFWVVAGAAAAAAEIARRQLRRPAPGADGMAGFSPTLTPRGDS
jgi:hypothetical protein